MSTREQLLQAAKQRRLEKQEYDEMVEWICANGTDLLKKGLRILCHGSHIVHQRYLRERFGTKPEY
jgi:hypothetical protein